MAEIITLTEAAAGQVKGMMAHNEIEDGFLRVSVKGGGCSGLSYGMEIDHEKTANDILSTQHGVQVLIDKENESTLKGVTIDFKESMAGGGFTIDNPNAVSSCGCGSSFRTESNQGSPGNC